MSAPNRFDNLLDDWLEEGPESVPREDLAIVLEGFPRIRQRSGFGPWRRPMPTFVRLAVAAVLAIAVGAVVLGQMIQPSGPSVGAESTPGWEDRFPTQTASTFVRPFTYAIDPSSGVSLANGDRASYQFRIPGGAEVAVVVRHPAEGIRLDPCTTDGGAVNARPTPEEFVSYMQTVPGLKVTRLPPTTIDGRTALGIDVQQRADPACQEHFIFAADDDWTCCWPDDPMWVRRIWAIDVEGALVLVTTPHNSTNKEAQLAIANAFVDTIHFGGGDASPSAPN